MTYGIRRRPRADVHGDGRYERSRPFDFDDHVGDGPVVLAFFPGAFTPPCTNEMVALRERGDEFSGAGATVFGIGADSPFSQGAFREERGIEFDLISDTDGDAIRAYDLEADIPDLGLHAIADLGLHAIPDRAAFVVDGDREIAYEWAADDPTTEPDYDDPIDAVESA